MRQIRLGSVLVSADFAPGFAQDFAVGSVPGSAGDFAIINAEGFASIIAGDFATTIAAVDSGAPSFNGKSLLLEKKCSPLYRHCAYRGFSMTLGTNTCTYDNDERITQVAG